MTRALALVSGGLDSILAAKMMMEQDVDVIGLCFTSPFFGYENAVKMAEQIKLPLKIVDFTDEHFNMVKNPKHGYGKNMNPCIDCHAMMMRYAGRLLDEMGAEFIITGEVLNQRPMSQNRSALDVVRKESGYEDKILRPLCAKNLPSTNMEKAGIIERDRLLNISGRSRKVQMELAEKWGIAEYPSPAGGCKLTDPNFSSRLKDLFEYNKDCTPDDVEILKYGRHFRINDRIKVISARDEREENVIKPLIRKDDYLFFTSEHNGSLIILQGEPTFEDVTSAAGISGRYSRGRDENRVEVKYKRLQDKEYNIVIVKPAKDEGISGYLI